MDGSPPCDQDLEPRAFFIRRWTASSYWKDIKSTTGELHSRQKANGRLPSSDLANCSSLGYIFAYYARFHSTDTQALLPSQTLNPHQTTAMATMKAVIMQPNNTASLVTDRPTPSLRPTYLLVRTKAVALNPTDYKHVDKLNTPGHLLGVDFAGEVLEIGSDVHKAWNVGDRICGFVHGGNSLEKEDGAFAEVIVAKGDIALKMPEGMSFEEAATLGAGVLTCGQGLYQKMGLSWPNEGTGNGEVILIYGGSTATGTLGIQFAKL